MLYHMTCHSRFISKLHKFILVYSTYIWGILKKYVFEYLEKSERSGSVCDCLYEKLVIQLLKIVDRIKNFHKQHPQEVVDELFQEARMPTNMNYFVETTCCMLFKNM